MQILKDAALATAAENRAALTDILSVQKATNDAAIIALAKDLSSSLAAGENSAVKSVTLDVTPNVLADYDHFLRKVTLTAPDALAAIPLTEGEMDCFLQAPSKKTRKRNVRISCD